jgi:hypothetical protein
MILNESSVSNYVQIGHCISVPSMRYNLSLAGDGGVGGGGGCRVVPMGHSYGGGMVDHSYVSSLNHGTKLLHHMLTWACVCVTWRLCDVGIYVT